MIQLGSICSLSLVISFLGQSPNSRSCSLEQKIFFSMCIFASVPLVLVPSISFPIIHYLINQLIFHHIGYPHSNQFHIQFFKLHVFRYKTWMLFLNFLRLLLLTFEWFSPLACYLTGYFIYYYIYYDYIYKVFTKDYNFTLSSSWNFNPNFFNVFMTALGFPISLVIFFSLSIIWLISRLLYL